MGFRGPDGRDVLRVRSLYDLSTPHRHTATSGRAKQRAANAAASAEERCAAERDSAAGAAGVSAEAGGSTAAEAAAGGSAAAEGTECIPTRHFTFPSNILLRQMFETWEREILPRDRSFGLAWRSFKVSAPGGMKF